MRAPNQTHSRRPKLPVFGVTGGVGSGKTLVARYFQTWGAIVVSGDEIGRDVLNQSEKVRRQLSRAFGSDILRGDRVRRSLLARRVFANEESILQLNDIVHPPLIRELNRQVAGARKSRRHVAVVIDAALLAEWGIGKIEWNALVGVWAPLRLRRLWMSQRGWSTEEISARIRRQMTWTQRRKLVDYVVKNDDTLTMLERRARHCWQKLLSSQTM